MSSQWFEVSYNMKINVRCAFEVKVWLDSGTGEFDIDYVVGRCNAHVELSADGSSRFQGDIGVDGAEILGLVLTV